MPLFARKKESAVQAFVVSLLNQNCHALQERLDGPRLEGRVNLTMVVMVVPVEEKKAPDPPGIHGDHQGILEFGRGGGRRSSLWPGRGPARLPLAGEHHLGSGQGQTSAPHGRRFLSTRLSHDRAAPSGRSSRVGKARILNVPLPRLARYNAETRSVHSVRTPAPSLHREDSAMPSFDERLFCSCSA